MELYHLCLKEKDSLPLKPLVKGFKLDIWTRIAITIAILVYLSVIGLTLLFPEFDFRLTLLIVGLVYLGMPHGAMDIYLVSKSIKSKYQILNFILAYLLLSSFVIALWAFVPTFSFLFFLIYSMIHFADSDIQKEIFRNKKNLLEFSARLPLTFCLPLIFFEKTTLDLIQFIHPEINFLSYVSTFQFFGYLGMGLTVIFAVYSFYLLLTDFSNQDLTFLEPLVLCVLFSQITPLYAFGIYFCFIHAIKHIVNVVRKIEITSVFSILPYWIIPLMGLPLIYWIYLNSGNANSLEFQQNIFQYILITLSALALPHAILVRYCKNLKFID